MGADFSLSPVILLKKAQLAVVVSATNQFGKALREKQKGSTTDKLWTKRKTAFLSHLLGVIFFLSCNRKSGQ